MECIRKLFVTLLVIMFAGVVWAEEKPPVEIKKDQVAIVRGNNEFALELYAKLREREGNLFFSPFSISTALAMTYTGARGETEAQMAEVMRYALGRRRMDPAFAALLEGLAADKKEQGYELVVANALWAQEGYGFLEEFLDLTRKYYGAGLHEVDFRKAAGAARKRINAWVEEKTRNKIKDLVKPGVLSSLTRLVLTNAIYFKGSWASRFKEKETADAEFALLSSKKVTVPMMKQVGEFGYMEEESFQALELPYAGDRLSMVIFLPRKVEGLAGLERSLTAEKLSQWLPRLRRREVAVSLPRFTVTSEFSLAGVLGGMGMSDAFSLPPADFSGMDGKKDLFISAVIHKAFVEVNEEGTEAAAATAVMMELTSASPEPVPVFNADHPFVFLIRDTRSKSILFMGRLAAPYKLE